MDLTRYTSYETSVALRDAGAPQGPDRSEIGEMFWRAYKSDSGWRPTPLDVRTFEVRRTSLTWSPNGQEQGQPSDVPGEARAFRLDEILEALMADKSTDCDEARDCLTVHVHGGTATVEVKNAKCPITTSLDGSESSLVEAAAACLLAVLRSRA